MSVYVVDSNFFIQAHRMYYLLDVVFSFWEKVKQLAEAGKIISVDKVKQEIYQNEDALKTWCDDNLPPDFFKDTQPVIASYRNIVTWAASKGSHYTPNAIAEFLEADEADAWIIAFGHAKLNDRTIVTYESSEPQRKNKIKIPDVCIAHGFECVDTIGMFRKLGEGF
ncbi:MAG TPA: DUF4411 family protein [Paludibacter sp.]